MKNTEHRSEYGHTSVLLHSSIEGLAIQKGDIFVDGTLGSAGHSVYVCGQYGPDITVVGIDEDQEALDRSGERLANCSATVHLQRANYRNIDTVLSGLSLDHADRILLDLGLSSNQFEESGRGFSFKKDEPLYMTFRTPNDSPKITAEEIINTWSEESLSTIIHSYGEERFASRIAKAIVASREEVSIKTTADLVGIIKKATPIFYHFKKIHPATRTFQALRITVNDEIEALKEGLDKSFELLSSGGRIAVISFHSIEDRIVKRFFRQKADEGLGELITKKPIVPTDKEVQENPRSRSAKLRIIKKN